VGVEFRVVIDEVTIGLAGPTSFVREHLAFLAPALRRATGAGPPPRAEAPAAAAEGIGGIVGWWQSRVPSSPPQSIQDSILLFAYFMRSYRKTVFLSEDIRRCFQVLGVEEPRSLLQILGTLKRDHGLLLNAGRRGEYMMNTTGINRAREILGEARTGAPAPTVPKGMEPLDLRPKPKGKGRTDARNIFKD
jgi:hypothetical protein